MKTLSKMIMTAALVGAMFSTIAQVDVLPNGNVGVGTENPQAALEVASTTSGMVPPRMTSDQREDIESPLIGSIVFDIDQNCLALFNGVEWGCLQFTQIGSVAIDEDDDGVVDSLDTCPGWDDNLLGQPCDSMPDHIWIDCDICESIDEGSDQHVVMINEIDVNSPGSDNLEFIELFDGGEGNTLLDGYVLVLFNGSTDLSYKSIDLDGYSTDSLGYFVIGNSNVENVDYIVGNSTFQNGADAAALILGSSSDYPSGTAIPSEETIIDAIVYDTDDADDIGLLSLINPQEIQVNENAKGDTDNHSSQRCPNGTGGFRNTSTYSQYIPTPGESNDCLLEVADSDNDGISDDEDQCPGWDDNLIGQVCAQDPIDNPTGYWAACGVCEMIDSDNDGIADTDDQCPGWDDALLGTSCDDADDTTVNDSYIGCNTCQGEFIDDDGDGVANHQDQCPGWDDGLLGTSCDDGDASTVNDIHTACNTCQGDFIDDDGDGVANHQDQCPGWDDGLLSTSCDDGDASTVNDIYTECNTCAGDFIDDDGDGIANHQDLCPGWNDALINTSCDDGDASTVNDNYSSCNNCAGQFIDDDGDGIANHQDNCSNTHNSNQADMDGDGIGDACDTDIDGDGVANSLDCGPTNSSILGQGSSCDDGSPLTINDALDASCGCTGSPNCDSWSLIHDFHCDPNWTPLDGGTPCERVITISLTFGAAHNPGPFTYVVTEGAYSYSGSINSNGSVWLSTSASITLTDSYGCSKTYGN